MFAAVLKFAGDAHATGSEEQRVEVRARLEAQRTAVALLESRRGDVLAGIDLLERHARISEERVVALEADRVAMQHRLARADVEERLTRSVLEFQRARLSPRLLALYRLTRRKRVEALLSARDVSGLVWRSRALSFTLEADLSRVAAAARAAEVQAQAGRTLEEVRRALEARSESLRQGALEARVRREALQEVVGAIAGQAEQERRLLRGLEQADAELNRLLSQLRETGFTKGFGALRGRLPLPAEGFIEAAYGRVVEPRFHTVTLRRGMDIRAPRGAPVRAVAAGTVAFAGWMRGYGNLLILDHGEGFHTLLAHLDGADVAVGTPVEAGQPLGSVGDTGSLKGPFLYFELRRGGEALDPGPWLAPEG